LDKEAGWKHADFRYSSSSPYYTGGEGDLHKNTSISSLDRASQPATSLGSPEEAGMHEPETIGDTVQKLTHILFDSVNEEGKKEEGVLTRIRRNTFHLISTNDDDHHPEGAGSPSHRSRFNSEDTHGSAGRQSFHNSDEGHGGFLQMIFPANRGRTASGASIGALGERRDRAGTEDLEAREKGLSGNDKEGEKKSDEAQLMNNSNNNSRDLANDAGGNDDDSSNDIITLIPIDDDSNDDLAELGREPETASDVKKK
jgi:hypothetical protein